MTTANQAQITPPASSFNMIYTLGGIAMLSGFLVVLVFQLTLPMIEANKQRAIDKALFQVLPDTAHRMDFTINNEKLSPFAESQSDGIRIYAGYTSQGRLTGIATEAAAQGYQDVIRILFGYNPGCECITGIKVLKMSETPGLGDKIAKDPEFLRNFVALDAKLNMDKSTLLHPITTVKHGKKQEPWQIDSISGATISSKAIGKMLNQSTNVVAPLIAQHLLQLNTAFAEVAP